MKKQFLLALLILPLAYAQQKQPVSSMQEDCGVSFFFNTPSSGAQATGTFTAGSTGTTPIIDNRQVGCIDWIVTYSPNTAAATVSLDFQIATDVLGVPTTWSDYPGTLNSGINPNTAVTAGGAITDATGPKYPFLRMNMTVLTGAGATISGRLYGWKRRPANVTVTGGGGCVGTIATPCVVVGPTAAGSAPVASPVLAAGQDGAPGVIRVILTDSSGRQVVNVNSFPANTPFNLAQVGGTNTVTGGVAGSQGVGGLAAAGAAATGNSVRIGGTDVGGTKRDVLTDTSGRVEVVTGTGAGSVLNIEGIFTNNNAAPAASQQVGVLPCVANAAAQTWTEGDQVLCSVDLKGNQRMQGAGTAGTPSGGVLSVQGVSGGTSLPVSIAGNAAILSGQQAVTGSAVALATNTVKNICIKALLGNTINVYVGPTGVTTATGYELDPGANVCMPVTNTNLPFVIASTTGASVSWIATN